MSELVDNILKEFLSDRFLVSPTFENTKARFGVVKKLNAGSNGIAYLTSDDKILKFTKDFREVYTAKKMKPRNLKHYVEIYKIIKLRKGDYEPTPNGYYAILMEKLTTITDVKDRDYVNYGYYVWGDYFSPNAFYYEKYGRMSIDKVEKFLNSVIDGTLDISNSWFEREIKTDPYPQRMIAFVKQYCEMRAQLDKFNLVDVHADNLGFKTDGTLAAFDLL